MEYRDDLFLTLLDGLPSQEQTEVLSAIDRATAVKRRQIQEANSAEDARLGRRRESRRLAQSAMDDSDVEELDELDV